jgi:hypothetical protein
MIYNLPTKTGFRSMAPIVAVYTKDYEPFYIKNRVGQDYIYFNLPKGEYIIESTVERLSKPVNYKLPPLPKYERVIKKPKKDIDIYFVTNPNKCSIDLVKGIIYCDLSIKAKSSAEQMFVLYHELGHYYYKTESYCDIYASRELIKLGFNPSQLYFSVNGCLSDRSSERKEAIYNFAKKIKK